MLNSPSHDIARCAFGKSGAKVVFFCQSAKYFIKNMNISPKFLQHQGFLCNFAFVNRQNR